MYGSEYTAALWCIPEPCTAVEISPFGSRASRPAGARPRIPADGFTPSSSALGRCDLAPRSRVVSQKIFSARSRGAIECPTQMSVAQAKLSAVEASADPRSRTPAAPAQPGSGKTSHPAASLKYRHHESPPDPPNPPRSVPLVSLGVPLPVSARQTMNAVV